MSAVFGDTYYFLGLLNRSDRAHQKCINFARRYTGLILTTEYVLVELLDGLSSPCDRRGTADFVRSLAADPGVEIIRASPSLFENGLVLYEQRSDKSWSLTDCTSFSVMTENGLTDALTADHDFEQAGFNALLK